MGIQGLLQFLKPCFKERNLRQYRGLTVAVDSYAWLHRIIKGPAGIELIKGGPNRFKYVKDCIKRIEKLQRQGIKVIMVFDGGPLPNKKDQEEIRAKKRAQNHQKAYQLLRQGSQEGYKKMVQSLDITPDVALQLINQLKTRGISYIIAPYEADAQLAYLSRIGIADVVLTQDGDLLAFGAKKVLYKVDFTTMTGLQIEIDFLQKSKDVALTWFTHCQFLTMCILSGCDYLSQIQGVGIKTAHKIVGRRGSYKGVLEDASISPNIPLGFQEAFIKAFLTFRFQRVYCPLRKQCVEINSGFNYIEGNEISAHQNMAELAKQIGINQPSLSILDWSKQVLCEQILSYLADHQMENTTFLGYKYSASLATAIAEGDAHPCTHKSYVPCSFDYLNFQESIPLNSTILSVVAISKSRHWKQKPLPVQSLAMKRFLEGKSQVSTDPKSREKTINGVMNYGSINDTDMFLKVDSEQSEHSLSSHQMYMTGTRTLSKSITNPLRKNLLLLKDDEKEDEDSSNSVCSLTDQYRNSRDNGDSRDKGDSREYVDSREQVDSREYVNLSVQIPINSMNASGDTSDEVKSSENIFTDIKNKLGLQQPKKHDSKLIGMVNPIMCSPNAFRQRMDHIAHTMFNSLFTQQFIANAFQNTTS